MNASRAAWRCPGLAAGAVGAALLVAACGPPPLIRLPSDPGVRAADGPAVVAEATAACARIASIVAQAGVTGSIGRQRVRATLHLGVALPASARIEAVAPFGRPLFTFVSRGDRGTLVLTRPDRVVADENPLELLEAVTGVPLDPPGLRAALTGCAERPAADDAWQVGDAWRIVIDGSAQLFFRQASEGQPWRLVAAVHREPGRPDWRAEYHDHVDGLPTTVRLISSESEGFDLRLGLSQVEINTPLADTVFAVDIPAGAERLTLDQLRGGVVLTEVAPEDAGSGPP